MKRYAIPILLFTAVILAVALRIIQIGQESFFIDEAVVARSLSQPTWHYAETIEVSPPLYFYLIKGWSIVFGSSHTSLRAFSALCGSIAVLLMFFVARELGLSSGISLLPAITMATSPMAFWFSQQARHYALLSLWVTAWLWLFLRVKNHGRKTDLILLVLILFLGFSTHYYFAFAITGGLLLIGSNLLFQPKEKRLWKICIAHGVACLSWFAYIPLFRKQMSLSHLEWHSRPKMRDMAEVYADIFPGGPFNHPPEMLQILILVLFILSMGITLFVFLPKSKRTEASRSKDRFNALFLIFSAILPILIPLLISIWVKPIFYKERYSIIALPAFYLLITYGIAQIPWQGIRKLSQAIVLISFLLPGLYFIAQYWRSYQDFDWIGSIRIVESQWKQGDALTFFPSWLEAAYSENGGKKKFSLQSNQIESYQQFGIKRLWVFEWEQNPSKEEMRLIERLKKLPNSKVRTDFSHMKLIEAQLP